MFANLSVNCCGFDKYFSECFYKGLVPSVEVWEVLWTFKRWALWNVLGFIGSMTLKIFMTWSIFLLPGHCHGVTSSKVEAVGWIRTMSKNKFFFILHK
jgi:hypothetical protein